MKTRSKFDQDFYDVYSSTDDVVDRLLKKFPEELVTLVLLWKIRDLLDGFTDYDQWELIKDVLLEIRDNFRVNVEPHLSGLIDHDVESEKYNKRYA